MLSSLFRLARWQWHWQLPLRPCHVWTCQLSPRTPRCRRAGVPGDTLWGSVHTRSTNIKTSTDTTNTPFGRGGLRTRVPPYWYPSKSAERRRTDYCRRRRRAVTSSRS